jgi:hypothetical protein
MQTARAKALVILDSTLVAIDRLGEARTAATTPARTGATASTAWFSRRARRTDLGIKHHA